MADVDELIDRQRAMRRRLRREERRREKDVKTLHVGHRPRSIQLFEPGMKPLHFSRERAVRRATDLLHFET
jgi:hypothetical protein